MPPTKTKTKTKTTDMTRHRCAVLIQQFYRKYIKAQRDPVTHYPLDPISREGIMPGRRIRILMEGGRGNIQYFDVQTLHQWFKTCLKPLNPLTNTNFTASQLGCIVRAYENMQKTPPSFIVTATASATFKAKAAKDKKTALTAALTASTAASAAASLECKIIMAAALEAQVEWIRHALFSNVSDIQQGHVNLNYKMPLPKAPLLKAFVMALPLDLMVTPLMCATYYDNIAAVKELLYFNLDINTGHGDVRAADLALISTQPNSLEILRWLLHYGARLGNWDCLALITDCQKLELVSSF